MENVFLTEPEDIVAKPSLKVLGLGGGGSNAVNRMIESGVRGVEYVVANTDRQALLASLAPVTIQLGPKTTRGMGAGGDPQVGYRAAEESRADLAAALEGADMVFLTAGMGGGSGTGAIPIAAEIARSIGAVTIAIVTTPFSFEGKRRLKNAQEGMAWLRPNTDTLIAIPNDRLLYVACTRAKKSLHLIGHVNTTRDGAEMRQPHSGSLLSRLWPALEAVFTQEFAQYEVDYGVTENDAGEMYVAPRLRRSGKSPLLPRPPELPLSVAASAETAAVADRAVEFYWVGTAARHAGTIVHRWLHAFVQDGHIPDAEHLGITESMTRRWAQDLRVAREELDFVCQRVQLALSGILQDAQGRWILGGEGCAELALTGLWQDRIASIVIDRVRIDEHGVHWIIDYKTSTHEGGDLEAFLQHEADRYQQQLQKYSSLYRHYANVPVKAALYFPLLQQFREVPLTACTPGPEHS